MRAYLSTLEIVGAKPGPKRRAMIASTGAEHRGAGGELVELRPGMVPFRSIARIAQTLHIDESRLLQAIGMSGRTAIRRRKEGHLKLDEADRLLRVARVVEEALRIFGSEDKASRWLKTPHPMLGDTAPVDLLDSDAGARSVSDELVRVDYGDFA